MKEKLLSRIAERKITVGVVGLGYVGLPLAVEKAKAGFRTIGFDVQEEKVKQVNAGHKYRRCGRCGAGAVGTERYAQRHFRFFLYKGCGLCSHLCAYAFGCAPGTGHQLCGEFGEINSRASDRRHHRSAGVHNLSRHYRRAYKTDS